MTQATQAPARTRAQISERTLGTDPWWKAPRITASLLTIWVAYATSGAPRRAFLGQRWHVRPFPRGRRIRVAEPVLEDGPISCGLCKGGFTAQ